jgi:tetratricopeptide (TPR) repeat protein
VPELLFILAPLIFLILLGLILNYKGYSLIPNSSSQESGIASWVFFAIFCCGIAAFVWVLGKRISNGIDSGDSFTVIVSFLIFVGGVAVIAILFTPFFIDMFFNLASSLFSAESSQKVQPLHSKIRGLIRQGHYEEAAARYEAVLKMDPEDSTALLDLGDIYSKYLNQPEKGLRYYLVFLEQKGILTERWCMIQNRVADIYVTIPGGIPNAVAHLQQIMDKYPNSQYSNFARDRIRKLDPSLNDPLNDISSAIALPPDMEDQRVAVQDVIDKLDDEIREEPGTAPPPISAAAETETETGERIGYVSRFFKGLNIATVELVDDKLCLGDRIHIKGRETDLTQEVYSLLLLHEQVEKAERGQSIGVRVDSEVNPNDEVFKL